MLYLGTYSHYKSIINLKINIVMEILLYVSLVVNVLLLVLVCFLTAHVVFFTIICHRKLNGNLTLDKNIFITEQPLKTAENPNQQEAVYLSFRELVAECEAKLPPQERGLIKLLVEKEYPSLPAILQVGDLKISLKRFGFNRSLFEPCCVWEALTIARDGYNGTTRYIPVPKELEFILSKRDAINVYLQALGLETISAESTFWTVDIETGRNTGWKRFDCNIGTAFRKLRSRFRLRTPEGYDIASDNAQAKLLLLLKGWEHLFTEV